MRIRLPILASMLVALALLFAFAGRDASVPIAAAEGDGPVTLTLLHNNDGESSLLPLTNVVDIEGSSTSVAVGGIAAYKAVIDREIAQARASGNAVVNVYAGDSYLASATFICGRKEGNPLFDAVAQDAIPYDAHILGNHEFDLSPDFLERFIRAFDGQPFLSANLDFSAEPGFDDLVDADGLIEGAAEDGRVLARSMIVIDDVTGARFGIVGATTPSLPVVSIPRKVTVTPDLATTAAAVQAEIDRLLDRGVNKIIFVSHLQGIDYDVQFVGLLSGVDVAVAGGGSDLLQNPAVDPSLQVVPGERGEPGGAYPIEVDDADGRTVYVVTAPGNYKYAGRLDVQFDDSGEVTGIVSETSYPRPVVPASDAATAAGFTAAVEKDAALVQSIEAPVIECLAGLAATRVATTEVLLDVSRGVRTRGTNAGNLVTDAMLASFDRYAADLGLPARGSANPVIALQNSGGIRQNAGDVLPVGGVVPGDISRANTLDVLPFGNGVTVVPGVAPADLKAVFEHSVSRYPAASGAFLQVAGISVVYDTSREPGSRVVSLTLGDGAAIVSGGAVAEGAPDVSVVASSFIAAGGDGYDVLGRYPGRVQLPTSYEQSLHDYLASLGTISADDARYAPDGPPRIAFREEGQEEAPIAVAEDDDLTFTFDNDAEGWVVDFADLPADYDQEIYELAGEHRPLPEGLDGGGIYVQGHNRSDDLFMYLTRQVGGLRPNTAYSVSVSLDLATDVSPGLVGIGGSPGESVFVKAGASAVEPTVQVDEIGHLRLNIDKGNQSQGGEAMVVLGNIAHPGASRDAYAIKTLTNADAPLTVTTDGEGRLWLIVGTDSGFEGLTTLYYARIAYTLTEVTPPEVQEPDAPEPAATGNGLSRSATGGWPAEAWVVVAALGAILAGAGFFARQSRRRP
ncbi:MAG: bifunctional metallophosphatase/5'-nucleotidase [Chloroflexota bacterium]|nr:bifunctional metallophosphatase/5'-nucleotidase [Chloroflexota bacterium]